MIQNRVINLWFTFYKSNQRVFLTKSAQQQPSKILRKFISFELNIFENRTKAIPSLELDEFGWT